MREVERIAEQLTRAFEGEAWHGPSVKETLAGVTAEQASRRPIAGAHTIWEIVNHLGAWERVVVRRIAGEKLVEPAEGDWPPHASGDERAWKDALAWLEEGHRILLETVGKLDDARLDQPAAEGMSKVYVQLHGTVQHNLYHAGQIEVLKKG